MNLLFDLIREFIHAPPGSVKHWPGQIDTQGLDAHIIWYD